MLEKSEWNKTSGLIDLPIKLSTNLGACLRDSADFARVVLHHNFDTMSVG